MRSFVDDRRTIVIVLLCAALIIGSQSLAASASASVASRSTGAVAQRAGFAYVTGIRTAVAAMLWNRLGALLHGYYETAGGLSQAAYAVPTIALVNMLDPTMEDPYTVGAWIVGRNASLEDSLAVAKTGAYANPRSAHLWANYAQILMFFKKDAPAAAAACDRALQGEWRDDGDELTDLQFIRIVYRRVGRHADAEAVAERARELQRRPIEDDRGSQDR